MKSIRNILAGGFAFALLSACNTTPNKPDTQAPVVTSSAMHEQSAHNFYAAWEKDYKIWDLFTANTLYKKLHEERPDDINLQRAYYATSVILYSIGVGPKKEDIANLFSILAPNVREVVVPPARFDFLNARTNNEPEPVLVELVKKGIKQYPEDSFFWYNYSTLMESQKRHWFSVALAKRAFELSPEDHEYAFQVADTVNDVIQSTACTYEQGNLAKIAAKHYSLAATLKPKEQLYVDNIGLQYLRLGVLPIAYAKSKEAYNLEKNEWTADHFASSAVLLKKYAEVESTARHLISELNEPLGHVFLAMVYAQQGDWASADKHYRARLAQPGANFFSRLIHQWVKAKSGASHTYDLASLKPQSEWQQAVLNYLASENKFETELVDRAENTCERTEAYFYTAMKMWLRGNTDKSDHYLRLTLKEKSTLYLEYLWASIMLDEQLPTIDHQASAVN